MLDSDFGSKFSRLADLASLLLSQELRDESVVFDAMRYSVEAGGKRFRPVLVFASAEMLGVEQERVAPFALAVELLHTGSLVHDDLPALDNDELRRGMPTVHKVFGEAIAVLAGDVFISEAFKLIVQASGMTDSTKVLLVELLAKTNSMLCDGQAMDLQAVKKDISLVSADSAALLQERKLIGKRHLRKTGALIGAAVSAPAYFVDEWGSSNVLKLQHFGEQLGLLYQIVDDILDVTSSSEVMGKDVASDERQGRPTYVSLYGLDGARALAVEVAESASLELKEYGDEAQFLRSLCFYVLNRTS